MSDARKRISWIDFGKGLTIFFVLLVHVLEGLKKTQLYVDYERPLEISLGIIFTFIMPVFFALSGYLYRPTRDWRRIKINVLKKLVSLGVPYLVFSILYVILQHSSSSSVHDLYDWDSLVMLWWQPIGYLWFLYVLFFIFCLVYVMDGFKVPYLYQLVIYMALFVIAQLTPLPPVFSRTFTWCITFYIGFLYKKYSQLSKRWITCLSVIILIVSLTIQYLNVVNWYETNNLTFVTFFSKIASIFIFFTIFRMLQDKIIGNYFTKYGPISLTIYVIHAPAASIFRVLLLKIGVSNIVIQIILGVIVVWYGCIFVDYLSNKFKPLDFIFYPNRYFKIGKLS